MNDETRDRQLIDTARCYREPPEPPRERMWQRIEAARTASRPASSPARWRQRPVLWPAAVAAALALGLLVGRLIDPATVTAPTDEPTVAANVDDPIDPDDVPVSGLGGSDVYRVAARPTLARAETLLLQTLTDDDLDSPSYSERAAVLLAQTRLLLASPAGDDPRFAPLLADLELALARLVHTSGQAITERQSLTDGIERKAVLPRIREELASGRRPTGL